MMQRKQRLLDQGFISKVEYEQAAVDYQAQLENIDADKKVTSSAIRCEVTGEGDAQRIAPEFSGKYLLVECHESNAGQPDSRSKLAWLQDLNIFVPVAQQLGDKPERLVTLENVSVTR